jgi:low temperature requirement protein LtrA
MSSPHRSPQTVVSPEDQSATFVELFFDLVFVFCVTQVVSLLYQSFTWIGVGQSILAFWMVWWAWTQFTWTLNAANAEHPRIQFGTLVATAVSFFMAVALPDAFHGRALAFAIPYVVVRSIGLYLHAWVACEVPAMRDALRTWAILSVGGLAAVLVGGIRGGEIQYRLWGLAILLDLLAAAVSGQSEGWGLHAKHFSERHGLFVIIALGETLIVTASGLTGTAWTLDLIGVAVLGVALSSALWWTYFPRIKPLLEHAMLSSQGSAQSRMGRDAFSLGHFPMLCGIVSYAVAIEQAATHPGEPLALAPRLALAAGLLLFVGVAAGAVLRCVRRVLVPRLAVTVLTALAIAAFGGVPAQGSLAIAFAGVLVVAVQEHRNAPR